MRLQAPDGTLHRLRCRKRTCAYCDRLDAAELASMLLVDARVEAPTTAITLTTSDPDTPASVYRYGSARVWRALRREFGRVEYAAMIEFTSGRALTSGGRRRMHGHHLGKGIPAHLVLEVEREVRAIWEAATGAYIVEVAALISPGAAIGYMGLHHRKPQQAPPADWSGKRIRWSQGYLHKPAGELRQEVRAWQADRRLRWAAAQRAELLGLTPEEAALDVQLERDRQATNRDGKWHVRRYVERPGLPLIPVDTPPSTEAHHAPQVPAPPDAA